MTFQLVWLIFALGFQLSSAHVSCPETGPGPHDIRCLRIWWEEAGCFGAGSSSPDSAPGNVNWWNGRTVEEVKADMAVYYQTATIGGHDYRIRCYGASTTMDCLWLAWSEWEACNVTCGGGEQSRDRITDGPYNGGADCVGDSTETRDCNMEPCTGSFPESCPETGPGPHDIRCLRSWWKEAGCISAGSSSPDSAPGNVAWWNERTVEGVKADMAVYYQTATTGLHDYRIRCYGTNDCLWQDWSEWGTCSVTCGGGQQSRDRDTDGPYQGGADCDGDSIETRDCNMEPCDDCEPYDLLYETRDNYIIEITQADNATDLDPARALNGSDDQLQIMLEEVTRAKMSIANGNDDVTDFRMKSFCVTVEGGKRIILELFDGEGNRLYKKRAKLEVFCPMAVEISGVSTINVTFLKQKNKNNIVLSDLRIDGCLN